VGIHNESLKGGLRARGLVTLLERYTKIAPCRNAQPISK
jgi:hypothetical protein